MMLPLLSVLESKQKDFLEIHLEFAYYSVLSCSFGIETDK